MRQALELLKPVGAIKKGANKVLNGILSMIGARGDPDDPLFPALTFYFVRLADTFAAYVTLYEHLSSSKLLPITPRDLMTRAWDLINHNKEWQSLAKGDFAEKLFREFHFTSPPSPEEPPRPPPRQEEGPQPNEVPARAGPLPIRPPPPPGGGPPGGGPPGGGPLPLPPPGRPNPQGRPWPQDQQPRGPRGQRGPRRRQIEVALPKDGERKLLISQPVGLISQIEPIAHPDNGYASLSSREAQMQPIYIRAGIEQGFTPGASSIGLQRPVERVQPVQPIRPTDLADEEYYYTPRVPGSSSAAAASSVDPQPLLPPPATVVGSQPAGSRVPPQGDRADAARADLASRLNRTLSDLIDRPFGLTPEREALVRNARSRRQQPE